MTLKEADVTVIRAAITQTTWTGDKESMLDKHEQFARQAKVQGAEVICFQELFYGPYFGITEDVKYYDYAEPGRSRGQRVRRAGRHFLWLQPVLRSAGQCGRRDGQ